jgi:hypothetical protein
MTDIPRPLNRLRRQPVETCRSGNPVGRRIGGRHDDRSATSGRDFIADSLQVARRAIIDSILDCGSLATRRGPPVHVVTGSGPVVLEKAPTPTDQPADRSAPA